jgi:multiple sugar transport system permease protein
MAELASVAVRAQARRISPTTVRNTIAGLLFASPWIAGLLLFYAYPIAAAFYFSFHDYNGLQAARFVGLENYTFMLSGQDPVFWTSVYNTLYYAVVAIPLGIVWALTLALLLNLNIRGQAIYRTIYFLPVLVPDVALSIVWVQMFNPQYGTVNTLIEFIPKLLGHPIAGPGWLASQVWAKPTLVLLNLWLAGQNMLIYLAGLQDVPQDLYDAAAVDGANWWQRLWHVTIPMITPVIFFNLITSLIGTLQFFTIPYVLTGGLGTPANALMFYSMLLYRQAFVFFKFGVASAMAWLMFLAALVLTVIIFRTSARWVYYGGETR